MPNTLRIKRRAAGGAAGAPGSLANAELAFNEQDDTLYYGKGTGGAGGTATSVIAIGGPGTFAPLNNPALTGTPSSPTAAADTNTTQIATTAFVLGQVSSVAPLMDGVAAVGTSLRYARADHVHPGDTTKASLINPSFSGTPTAPTAAVDANTTQLATTAFVVGQAGSATPLGDGVAAVGTSLRYARQDHVHPTDTSRAALASPTFTGTPAAPTAAANTNTTQIATTAFVLGQASSTPAVALGVAAAGSSNLYARADHVHVMPTFNQIGAATADVSFSNFKITTLADPTGDQDAANKRYVDSVAQGLDAKASVKVATTANITLSGLQTIDGVTVAAGDRVLVKNQTSAADNGIYVVSASTWVRSADMNAWSEVPHAFVFVEAGTTQADTGWACTSNEGGTLGTTPITWAQFSSAGAFLAGDGLTLVGNTFSVVGTSNRISVSGSGVNIASTYIGQSSITTLGTITAGTWNGTTITVGNGGTGATTLTGYVKGNGTSAFTASATIPNTDITGLGTMSTQAAGSVAITGGSITGLTTFDNITIDGGTF
jgi:hypothetical protein